MPVILLPAQDMPEHSTVNSRMVFRRSQGVSTVSCNEPQHSTYQIRMVSAGDTVGDVPVPVKNSGLLHTYNVLK